MTEVAEDLSRLERGEMPLAVSEMMARSGAFNVPADYFNQPVVSGVAQATPRQAPKRWGLYAGLGGVAAAVVLTVGIMMHGQNSDAQPTPTNSVATTPTTAPTAPPVAAPAGSEVKVATTPSDAEVFRDGKSLGQAPITIIVPKGETISLEIRSPQFVSKAISLDGSVSRLDVKLEPEKAATSPVKPPAGGTAKGTGHTAPVPGGKTTKPNNNGGGEVADPWGGKH